MYKSITLLIPFIGTALGALAVFFPKTNSLSKNDAPLSGFAAGVMIAAGIWSLIIPSIELSESSALPSYFPAVTGFFAGVLFLLFSDMILSRICPENKDGFSKTALMIFAVTLHNIPEGMAVGIAIAGAMTKGSGITLCSAMALSFGIAVQNLPEGAIVSMPLAVKFKKSKAFLYGVLSGAVEPVAGVFTVIFASLISVMLPYLLSFAAGAMFYVAANELIPESCQKEKGYSGVISFSVGFLLMMSLDVALG